MIAYLKGYPQILKDELIIKVNGVGYGVFTGQRLLSRIQTDEEIELYIYSHVREDRFELYGFLTLEQKRLFEMMLDVSGIGPKTALDIVDQEPSRIIEAVQNSTVSFFTAIPRIGKKTAQKIILELKSKLGSIKELNLGPRSQQEQDVTEALLQLGFDEAQVHDVVGNMDVENLAVQEAVKEAMKRMG